jgi:ferrochelatase
MLEVAEHYQQFDGKSPINEQNRQLLNAIRTELERVSIDLPVYWGNRNWHPLLPDTLREMKEAGKEHALAFFTNMFSSYSGCRQYRENIAEAQEAVGEGAPRVDRIRFGFNHPLFIEAVVELIKQSTTHLSSESKVSLLFTAHSIPDSMAEHCAYEEQLRESLRLVTEQLSFEDAELVFQSRSGPPSQPWLEPDVCDRIEQLPAEGVEHVVVVPIGFVSDHIEVLYDLDTEAAQACAEAEMGFTRVPTVGTHPSFVKMIVELIQERISGNSERVAIGDLPACHDVCSEQCCLYPRPQRRPH